MQGAISCQTSRQWFLLFFYFSNFSCYSHVLVHSVPTAWCSIWFYYYAFIGEHKMKERINSICDYSIWSNREIKIRTPIHIQSLYNMYASNTRIENRWHFSSDCISFFLSFFRIFTLFCVVRNLSVASWTEGIIKVFFWVQWSSSILSDDE